MAVNVEHVSSEVTIEPEHAGKEEGRPPTWDEQERFRAAAERASCLALRTSAEDFDD
jgi:hypothetical protein